jgi:hypothetical protein
MNISEYTFCKLRQKYGGLIPLSLRLLMQLDDECNKNKRSPIEFRKSLGLTT